jgi:hypothetical protein
VARANQILFRPIGQRRTPGKGDQLAVGPRREESGHGPILSSLDRASRADGLAKLSKLPASRAICRRAGSSIQAKVAFRCRRDAIAGSPWRRHARASVDQQPDALAPVRRQRPPWIRATIC